MSDSIGRNYSTNKIQVKKADMRYRHLCTEPNTLDQKKYESTVQEKAIRSHSSVFNLNVKQQKASVIHKQSTTMIQRYLTGRFHQEELNNQKGVTPYQGRKINQKKQAAQNIQKKTKQKSVGMILASNQSKWLVVREVTNNKKQKSEQKSNKSNIRQTQTSLKQEANQESLLNASQHSYFEAQKNMLRLTQYPTKNQQLLPVSNQVKFKNIKMTLKNLIRANKGQLKSNCKDYSVNNKNTNESDIHIICPQKMKDISPTIQKKLQRNFFQTISKKCRAYKGKHSANINLAQSKKIVFKEQSHIASAITIIPCIRQQRSPVNKKYDQINSSLSQQKQKRQTNKSGSQLRTYFRHKKRGLTNSKKNIGQGKSGIKEFSGWQIYNDFPQRQQFF